MKRITFLSLIFFTLFIIQSCTNNKKEQIIIFHAGSLSVPLKELADEYMLENPDIEIILEASGSVNCARKISDIGRDCDIMASADYSIIEQILIPDFCLWYIPFASNEMVIVYSDYVKGNINSENWHQVLLEDGVRYGRSDPNNDPCGYRTLMVFQLAEQQNNIPNLANRLSEKNIEYIRPKETDLLSLLEVNEIDYIFIYKSVAMQHKLNYIELNDSVNLSKNSLSNWYSNAEVEINGNSPDEKLIQKGKPMVYGLTIVENAPNKENAIDFLHYILNNPKAKEIWDKNGQSLNLNQDNKYKDKLPKGIIDSSEKN